VVLSQSIFSLDELKNAGFGASEVVKVFSATDLKRIGYTKDELKPLGSWPHDGNWQTFNQYWDCCFNLDYNSECCGVARAVRHQRSGSGGGGAELSPRSNSNN
jgi:hypothetical protein